MLRNIHLRIACAIASLVLLAVVTVTCGGSNHNNVSQAQAQAISSALFSAVNSAIAGGFTPHAAGGTAANLSLGEAVERAQSAQPSSCVSSLNGVSCNIPIAFQGPCPKGGTISVTGDFMYTLDNSGNGSDSSTLTVTPSACAVDSLTLNGDPNVMFSTQFNLQNNALAFPIMFSGKGGISFGPNPSGSCSIDVKATASSLTSCTVSGSICGRTVSGSC